VVRESRNHQVVGNLTGGLKMNRSLILVAVAAAVLLCHPATGFATSELGSAAQSFAVLGYAGVTNAHVDDNPQTTIYGNVGVSPGAISLITGFPPGIVTGGSIHGPDGDSNQALADVNTAYGVLSSLSPTSNLTGQDLGGKTLTPGVYHFDSTAGLTGTLTLDAQNNPNALFVFQVGSALTTASASFVNVINGDSSTEVYWLTGSAATLGSSTVFAGNILAYAGISLDSTAEILCGRAFSRTASVTLIDNVISNNNSEFNNDTGRLDFGSYGFSGGPNGGSGVIPEPITLSGLFLGVGTLGGYFRRRARR